MNDMVDRYVWAVARDLPKSMRDDVAREVRATIEDMLEARGSSDDETVRDVLLELGDPAELAAGYAGTKRYLIGPALYPAFVKLLRTVLLVALPIVAAATLAGGLLSRDTGVWTSMLSALNAAFMTGVMIAFWVTLAFFFIERSGKAGSRSQRAKGDWRPESLPQVAEPRTISLAETALSLVALTLLVAWIPWQRTHSVIHTDGVPVPFLADYLWEAWIPVFIAIVAVSMGIEVWKSVSGRWTRPLVIANIVADVVFAAFVAVLLGTQQVVDPEFLAAFEARTGLAFPGEVVSTVVLLVVLGICAWDSIECVLKYVRSGRARATGRFVAGVI